MVYQRLGVDGVVPYALGNEWYKVALNCLNSGSGKFKVLEVKKINQSYMHNHNLEEKIVLLRKINNEEEESRLTLLDISR
jgi:hypothetical protein